MARRVFFSFYYDRDVMRVAQVRNSWVVRAKGEAQPFLDAAEWEKIRGRGDRAVEAWIEEQLKGTSVTVVLVGSGTYYRPWVKHEIKRSYELGKGLLAVRIHGIKDPRTGADAPGPNPLDLWQSTAGGQAIPFSRIYNTYDWVVNDGYSNLPSWIEAAAKAAGR